MTLTVRVTVKESWNQLEKCNSATFHKDIHHCLSLFSVTDFCVQLQILRCHISVLVPPNTLSHCRVPMKRSLYQLNFSFISVGVLTTLWWTNTNKFFAADKLLTGRLCQLWTRANTSLSREKLFLAKQREEISPWRLQCCSTNKTFEGSNKTMPDLNSRPKQPLRFLPNIGDKIYHKYITT